MASAMLQMDVQSSEVRLHWREPQEGDKLRYRQSQEVQAHEESVQAERQASAGSSEALRHMMRSFGPPETFIAAVSCLKVQETRPDPRETAAKDLGFVKR